MNWHEVSAAKRREMDQVIAAILRKEPEKLNIVQAWISRMMGKPDYCDGSKAALQEWVDWINQEGVSGVIRILEDEGEESGPMRQNAPFAVLMPQDLRLAILEKYEAMRSLCESGTIRPA
jgi:hypothetical protein